MDDECTVRARFFEPPVGLRRYFTTFYLTEVEVAPGATVTDWLHPEWGGIRIAEALLPAAEIAGQPPLPSVKMTAQGPTSTTIRFAGGSFRMWGVGFLPLGWAQFVRTPARDLADVIVDGHAHPAFAPFVALADGLFGAAPDVEAELARISAFFAARAKQPPGDEAQIVAVHAALVDPAVSTVAQLCVRAGLPDYTIERLCRRHFGFAPQLLLRRQRFMRSIAQFMLDPSLKWIGALDDHYHDQAQFVRDFHRFMGMSPREYSSLPHPILAAVMRARFAEAGAAVQALHAPRAGSATAAASA